MTYILLAAFPLSLTSPGATVAMAVLAVYGLALMFGGDALSDDLRRAAHFMLGCYLLLVVVDLLNGGGIRNIETAFNYLPLLALAPFAHAARRLKISAAGLEIAIQVTLWLSLAIALVRYVVLDQVRPGGINLAPIGLAYVVAVWVVVALSLALEADARRLAWRIPGLAAGSLTILLTESKIALGAMIVGIAAVGIQWAVRRGRWRQLMAAAVIVLVPLAAASAFFMGGRYDELQDELSQFWFNGISQGSSLGHRFELAISGLRAFMESPLIGHGLAERMEQVLAHKTPDGPDISYLSYVHNDYVTHLLAYGIFGAVFLAAYYLLIARLVSRVVDVPMRRASFALLAMLATYMVAEVGFNMDPVTSVMTIALGLTLARGGPASQLQSTQA